MGQLNADSAFSCPTQLASSRSATRWPRDNTLTKLSVPSQTMSHVSDHIVLLLDHCAFNITMKAKDREGHGESLPGPYRVYGTAYLSLLHLIILNPSSNMSLYIA